MNCTIFVASGKALFPHLPYLAGEFNRWGSAMTKWVDQKRVEMHIIGSDAWQEVLDELEKPDNRYTPRHASTFLKQIAVEYSRIEQEATSLVGEGSFLSSLSEEMIEIACQEAVETIKR
jgi:hypothetical protein